MLMKKKPSSKATEVNDVVMERITAVPVVSGELEIKYQVNENLTKYENPATEIGYTGPQRKS